jgi:hypothetical protein
MDDLWTTFWNDLVGRLTGPLTMRIVMQPAMALIFATRDGIKDARAGRPPYFWTMSTHANLRAAMLAEGGRAVSRILVLAVIFDVIYQIMVFRFIHPIELIVVVLLLAFAPYIIHRGVANRIARRFIGPRPAGMP